jgi:hypothetical protein
LSTSGLQKRLAAVAASFVAIAVLASCEGSSGENVGDKEALEEMVVASTFDLGPETCLKYSTLHYLETTTHREGDAAIESCEESSVKALANPPTDVKVSDIEVEGDSATALVAYEGSVLGGQELRTGFVERDGRWKYHEMLGFVDFDSQKLITEMGRQGMMEAESPQEIQLIACVIGLMEELSAESLEEQVFGDTDAIYELADSCAAGSATS